MKSSRVLIRARKGVPAFGTPRQQACLFTQTTTSSSTRSSPSATTLSSRASLRHHVLPSSRTTMPVRSYASTKTPEALNKTPLFDLHVARGAKMVPFGGFHMPVQYADQSVSASHHFTRSHASLFDVGHMVQHRFEGPGAGSFLQRITPAGIDALPINGSTLSALLWPGTGGIVDDTIITKLGEDEFYVVTNAACRDKDLAYLEQQLAQWEKEGRGEVRHKVLDGWGLVAVQGPLAEEVLGLILEEPTEADIRNLFFGQCCFVNVKVDGGRIVPDVLVSRGGYTGEDGFEISIRPEDTVAVTETLLNTSGSEKLKLAGLGARDSLRLEAGLCLYGHDLDDSTTPVEGALSWIIGKERRIETDIEKGAFYGADIILKQLTPKSKGGAGVERRRIGLVVEGAPAREGADIVDAEGQKVGSITSGCPSPTLEKNIAMGYIKDGLHKAGTEVSVVVRGKTRKAVVTKMPFVPTKYWKGPSTKA
ncbi:glycine cleavage system T protein [Hypoxylon trugodes]|uniref:glycine cleavage system T protein n=1 Tax=Hypoxylon trugodes TaxID=326681 RepID=UPI0021977FB7|nr:glycine cleavage system T protein [Hypoxylon trugodes]KAI1385067.1 glycine cleavage system T protein [Hypoxylon trugodes]